MHPLLFESRKNTDVVISGKLAAPVTSAVGTTPYGVTTVVRSRVRDQLKAQQEYNLL
jgi:hypothetical protein